MFLNISPIEYSQSALEDWLPGILDNAGIGEASPFEVYRVSSAPPTGHSLDECEDLELKWRSRAADVLAALKGNHQNCVVWAQGPFDRSGLLPVLSYIERWNRIGLRYHVEGFTYPGGRGYCTSWLSFEFEYSSFAEIMKDNTVDFETARIAMVICGPVVVDSIIGISFGSMDTLRVLEQHGMLLASPRHFEGFDVLGLKDVLRGPIATVRGVSDPCVGS